MDISSIQIENNKVFIETEELILTVNQDQIYFVRLLNKQKVQILGHNFNYSVSYRNTNLVDKLQESGFIPIKNTLHINPQQILEYNIKSQQLRFSNGDTILISNNAGKILLRYFVETNGAFSK